MRALVVEDEPALQDLYGRILQKSGYDTVYASDGDLAIRLLEEHEAPQLIILDMRMPNLNGYAVLQYLQNYPGIEHIHVIIATASSSYEDYVDMLPSVDFMLKPIFPLQLDSVARELREFLAG